jgi:hypothetical protein
VSVHRKNVALCEALAAERPQDKDIRYALARGFLNLGEACKRAGRGQEAAAAYRLGARHFEAMTEGHPGAVPDRRGLAVIHCNLGCLQVELGQLAAAAANLRRAMEDYEAAITAQPGDILDRF